MARLTNIVVTFPPDYNGQEAMDENGEILTLISNFNANQLLKYQKLIKCFNSHAVFAISNEAWGFDEKEGYGFKITGFGLYVSNRKAMRQFWRHERKMEHVYKQRPGFVKGFVDWYLKPVKGVR